MHLNLYRGVVDNNSNNDPNYKQSWTSEKHILGGLRINMEMLKEDQLKIGESVFTFVLETNNEIIGCVRIEKENNNGATGEEEGEATIGMLCVDPRYQSNGFE
eukprot:gene5222-6501_t